MTIRFINAEAIRRGLTMTKCIDLMQETMIGLMQGRYVIPPRQFIKIPGDEAQLGIMPGLCRELDTTGTKLVTIYPENGLQKLPSHQGLIILFSMRTGTPTAVIDAGEITAIRTAAATGAATRALARRDAKRLALLGSGAQAHTHLAAMLAVRDITSVSVWSRTAANAEHFVRESRNLDLQFNVAETAREAVQNVDIVCSVTSSPDPVIKGNWLAPGTHVNLIGAHSPTTREADTDAVRRSSVFVEIREFALSEAGDIRIPFSEGAIGPDDITEISSVYVDEAKGRSSSAEITLYKSLGNAAQDIAAAHAVYKAVSS